MRIIYSKTNYRYVVYRALISVILGVVLVLSPERSLEVLVMCIGFLFLFSGILAFFISYRRQRMEGRSESVFSLNGVGSVILGLLLVSVPLFFTALLMFLLGGILVLAGMAQLATLSVARQLGNISPLNYLYPVLILAAGMVVIFKPWGSAAYVAVISGCAAIFYGLTDLVSHYRLNKLQKQYEAHSTKRPEIEDADYEEVK